MIIKSIASLFLISAFANQVTPNDSSASLFLRDGRAELDTVSDEELHDEIHDDLPTPNVQSPKVQKVRKITIKLSEVPG